MVENNKDKLGVSHVVRLLLCPMAPHKFKIMVDKSFYLFNVHQFMTWQFQFYGAYGLSDHKAT